MREMKLAGKYRRNGPYEYNKHHISCIEIDASEGVSWSWHRLKWAGIEWLPCAVRLRSTGIMCGGTAASLVQYEVHECAPARECTREGKRNVMVVYVEVRVYTANIPEYIENPWKIIKFQEFHSLMKLTLKYKYYRLTFSDGGGDQG